MTALPPIFAEPLGRDDAGTMRDDFTTGEDSETTHVSARYARSGVRCLVEIGRNRPRILLLFVTRSIGAPPFEKTLRMPGSLNHIVKGERSRWISKPLSARKTAEFPVVAIGASAGGLDACRKLLDALPSVNGMAFVIVQHLDPSHDSMMVDLLAGHTSMPVLLATDGMTIECERVYVIPPGVYLSVDDKGALQISKPEARHGARLPFDFLLNSLAREYGARAICVVLSGTGADGSLGLKAVKGKGGLVIAQDIREAGYDGMPRSAVATGAVDLVLRTAKIAEALVARERGQVFVAETPNRSRKSRWRICCRTLSLSCARRRFTILLFTSTARSSGASSDGWRWGVKTAAKYLDLLLRDANERDQLSRDLLINVTGFFRDAAVFDFLAKSVIPDLVRDHPLDRPLRILGRRVQFRRGDLLARHAFSRADRRLEARHQIADIRQRRRPGRGGERSRRPLSRLDRGRRVAKTIGPIFRQGGSLLPDLAELRSTVVFTVHDVLADPPFARLDFVSCRNLLIYLLPEAQAKVISIIHFALREGGLLLVGDAETVGVDDGRFAVVSKPHRIYRRVGGPRPGDFSLPSSDGYRSRARPGPASAPSRQIELAELCRRMMLEAYGPAAVLINRKLECLYYHGPVDRYLKVVPGRPVNDVIAMAREGVRAKLRSGCSTRAARECASCHARRPDEGRSGLLVIQRRRHAGVA